MILYNLNAKHILPKSIEKEATIALSHYPKLSNTKITFKFKKNINKSTMQARPTFRSFFRSKKNRAYVILISEYFNIADRQYKTTDMPTNILIGWFGHELGHIIDYKNRSNLNLLVFGCQYLFSPNHIIEAERTADCFAVAHGMEEYILETKNYILGHTGISESYRDRIKRYYLSPEEIMLMVEQRDL
ncbi:hypothetical protein OO009_05885 [Flavobacteriaceae bacterium KMM 6897]|nr:hypothetical protein [Flavobacteriaceae bacterium KMM 6897]MEB8345223.1 hypothetical protein [Flavobacteriaceae bacterium KMM 6898]